MIKAHEEKKLHKLNKSTKNSDKQLIPLVQKYIEQLQKYEDEYKVWINKDLATKKKWKVVYFHRPLYCSFIKNTHCTSQAKIERKFYEQTFFKHRVDLVFNGHVHAYERMYPIYKGKVDIDSVSDDMKTYTNPKYPTHVVCGTGGNKEHEYKCNYL